MNRVLATAVLFVWTLFSSSSVDCFAQIPGCQTCSSPVTCSCSPLGRPNLITGVDSANCRQCGEQNWTARGPLPWEMFAHGEYIGPQRLRHVGLYRLRVDDQLEFLYRLTRNVNPAAYRLIPGDIVQIESVADEALTRSLEIQPDGTITLPLGVGRVPAAGRTIDELRVALDQRFVAVFKEPGVTVTPIKVNSRLEDLRAVVDSRQGSGGQASTARVLPDGTVQLPGIGSVPAHGLTLAELKREIDARYVELLNGDGIEVTPDLTQRAPRFIYVLGEVGQPGRYELVGPTDVMAAIALAQGWNNGANLSKIVIFRRAEDWRLMATKIDIQGGLYGRRPIPTDNVWLRDSDVILVTKNPIKFVDDAIDLVFTQGVYAAFPALTNAFFYFRNDTNL